MRQPDSVTLRRWLARHLPDAFLVVALVVALALSLEGAPAPRTDLVEAAREAVGRQVGAASPGSAVAAGDTRKPG